MSSFKARVVWEEAVERTSDIPINAAAFAKWSGSKEPTPLLIQEYLESDVHGVWGLLYRARHGDGDSDCVIVKTSMLDAEKAYR